MGNYGRKKCILSQFHVNKKEFHVTIIIILSKEDIGVHKKKVLLTVKESQEEKYYSCESNS